MDFRYLTKIEREDLVAALRGNADGRNGLLMGRDTSFKNITPYEEEASDTEVINAIHSVPTHY